MVADRRRLPTWNAPVPPFTASRMIAIDNVMPGADGAHMTASSTRSRDDRGAAAGASAPAGPHAEQKTFRPTIGAGALSRAGGGAGTGATVRAAATGISGTSAFAAVRARNAEASATATRSSTHGYLRSRASTRARAEQGRGHAGE